MGGTVREAVDEAVYSGITMRRQDNEWNGRSEQKTENRSEVRTSNIKHMKGSVELTETTSIKQGNLELVESNSIRKSMHFDSSDKLRRGAVRFSLGGWSFPIQLDVDEESRRIAKTFPDIDKPGVDLRKLEEDSREKLETIIGGFAAAVYKTFSIRDESIVRREKTVMNVLGNPLVINVEKTYGRDGQHAFESISADITYENKAANNSLSLSTSVESEQSAMRDFLSQKSAEIWKREMDLKAMTLE